MPAKKKKQMYSWVVLVEAQYSVLEEGEESFLDSVPVRLLHSILGSTR